MVLIRSEVERHTFCFHPSLGHHHEVFVVLRLFFIENCTPFADDVVHLISIPVRVIIDMSNGENFACKVEIRE